MISTTQPTTKARPLTLSQPAMREMLSGEGSSVAEIESLARSIEALQAHVDKIDVEGRGVREELAEKQHTIAVNQSRMRYVMPGLVGGGLMAASGGLLGSLLPQVVSIPLVVAGSVVLAGAGILATTARMNLDEAYIRGRGAADRVEIYEAARQRTLGEIATRQERLGQLKQQQASLLERVQAEMSPTTAPPATIQMEEQHVRIGNLVVPRRERG